MAKIVASDTAPTGDLSYSLANVEFDSLPYETNDRDTIANAIAHPWLDVEFEEVEELADRRNPFATLDPKDDVLSAESSVAFDPEQIKADYPDVDDGSDAVAIDAGLDQTKVIETDSGVDLTVAAAEVDESSDEADTKSKTTKERF